MTPEEIRQKLKDAGINVGGWTATPEREVKSPLIERQKEAFQKLIPLLQNQILKDQEKVADLQIQLERLKNGGGV